MLTKRKALLQLKNQHERVSEIVKYPGERSLAVFDLKHRFMIYKRHETYK